MIGLDRLSELEVVLLDAAFQLFEEASDGGQVFLKLLLAVSAGHFTPILNSKLLVLAVLLWILDLDWMQEAGLIDFLHNRTKLL